MNPKLRTEAIVWRENQEQIQFLVQCDEEESFYRFLGGTVEFGETIDVALQREFHEEYALDIQVRGLKVVAEEYLNYGGKTHHRVTLIYEVQLHDQIVEEMRHQEYADVKMVWRTIDQLGLKEVAPLGIFEHLKKYFEIGTVHLKYGFD
ncbi:NUDIX domain-containing protein [Lederbergia sp. NSJ-179]|uniref:NUDIX domain-containing protein n=1 Tax=Lederbergia sp. NSJ-179 TaxID=2931402 RepID=UPI001FD029D3|nr:NUDIX domain-containing protein [Lederbergia sp. NSJ-179]MCJ7841388.1 NUDIX domain-containing protein [Lederbergia sp. NSJ-179]